MDHTFPHHWVHGCLVHNWPPQTIHWTGLNSSVYFDDRMSQELKFEWIHRDLNLPRPFNLQDQTFNFIPTTSYVLVALPRLILKLHHWSYTIGVLHQTPSSNTKHQAVTPDKTSKYYKFTRSSPITQLLVMSTFASTNLCLFTFGVHDPAHQTRLENIPWTFIYKCKIQIYISL